MTSIDVVDDGALDDERQATYSNALLKCYVLGNLRLEVIGKQGNSLLVLHQRSQLGKREVAVAYINTQVDVRREIPKCAAGIESAQVDGHAYFQHV